MKEISKYLNRYTRALALLHKTLNEFDDNGHNPPDLWVTEKEIRFVKSKVKRHRRELLELIKEKLNG